MIVIAITLLAALCGLVVMTACWLNSTLEEIKMTQQEALSALNGALTVLHDTKAQLTKVQIEVREKIDAQGVKLDEQSEKIDELTAIINAGGDVSPEVQKAIDALQSTTDELHALSTALDAVVPDAPPAQ